MKTFKRIGKVTVILLLAISIIILATVSIRKAIAEPLDTYHSGWYCIRTPAAEDGSTFAASLALDANDGDFSSKSSNAYHMLTHGSKYANGLNYSTGGVFASGFGYSTGGAWIFAFCGTDAADETFSFTMVGYARENGMAQVICEGDGVLGSQDVFIYPGGSAAANAYWADTINLDETTKWPSVAVYNSGDNQVAMLIVDMTGLEYVDFITYDVAGGAEASTIGVYGRCY